MIGLLFVHAVGRAGRAAWPGQAELPMARFVTRRGFEGERLPPPFTVDAEGDWIADQTGESSIVVGHSWSAVAVLASVLTGRSVARAAILIEPIATFVASDHPVVRKHMAELSPAFEPDLPTEQFRQRFADGMGFDLPRPESESAVRALERLRRHRPPWETALTPSVLDSLRIPVAVVTGGWSPLYEAIADALATFPRISRHTVPGSGHRPQDAPEFNEFLRSWMESLP